MKKRIIALALLVVAFGAMAPAQASEEDIPPVCDLVDYCDDVEYYAWWIPYQVEQTVWAYYWMAQYYGYEALCTVDRLTPPDDC